MKKIDLKEMLVSGTPYLSKRTPGFINSAIIRVLSKVMHLEIINDFLEENRSLKNLDFIQAIFDKLNFSYILDQDKLYCIPESGRLIIVCNHPLGGLDALAVLHAVLKIRKDVKILVSNVFMYFENLSDLFISYNVYNNSYQKRNIKNISQSLQGEEVLILFPAALVSGFTLNGIRDRKWRNGPVYFARKYKAPVLPVHIGAKNSGLFYFASIIHRRAAMILLARELINKQDVTISLKLGKIIHPDSFTGSGQQFLSKKADLLREQVYKIGESNI